MMPAAIRRLPLSHRARNARKWNWQFSPAQLPANAQTAGQEPIRSISNGVVIARWCEEPQFAGAKTTKRSKRSTVVVFLASRLQFRETK